MVSAAVVVCGLDLASGDHIVGDEPLSPASAAALATSVRLARIDGARLHLVAALDLDELAQSLVERSRRATRPTVVDMAVQRLEAIAAEPRRYDVVTTVEVSLRAPAPALIEVVRREGGDVVVVGTRERGAVARNLLGSTALKLLRRCPATVWVARDCVWEGPATVLAAIDLGDMAPRVLGAAARIAQRTGGALHVLHVVDFAAEGVLRKGAADTDVVAEYRRLKRQRAEEAVPSVVAASLGAATSGTGPRPQIHLRFGDVNATIVGVAEEFRADVCVLGSVVHSAAGAALVGLGRTAEYVLPRLRSSLVVVKPAQPSSAGD